ncbi:MAG: tetratricopeptide repeat protein [Elusimicrobiota bacterium]
MNKKIKMMTTLTLAFFFLSPFLFADDSSKELLEQVDQIYRSRTVSTGAAETLPLLEKIILQDSHHLEANWRKARSLYWIADHATNKKEKLRFFEEGISICEALIQKYPNSSDAHFWLSAHYGSYGENKGIMKSLALLKPIKRELNEIIRIDDHFQGGAGYRILGIVDYKVPGIAGGNKKRAKEYLDKAMAIDPEHAFNNYYMAEYFFVVGPKKEAKPYIEKLLQLTPTADVDLPDLLDLQKKGKKLLEKY